MNLFDDMHLTVSPLFEDIQKAAWGKFEIKSGINEEKEFRKIFWKERRYGRRRECFMKGFLCEPTLDGVFTGIYDIWADREKADHKKLFLEGEYEPELFFELFKS